MKMNMVHLVNLIIVVSMRLVEAMRHSVCNGESSSDESCSELSCGGISTSSYKASGCDSDVCNSSCDISGGMLKADFATSYHGLVTMVFLIVTALCLQIVVLSSFRPRFHIIPGIGSSRKSLTLKSG